MDGLLLLLILVFLLLNFNFNLNPIPKIRAFPISSTPNSSSLLGPWQHFQELKGCHMGQTLKGISDLKKYLHTFGYIPSSNFTDYFDSTIQSAIKTYQRNFNLNTTGDLDPPTISHLILPRCGVPDTAMKPAPPTTPALLFHNSVSHYTHFPGSPRWVNTRLSFVFSPENKQLSVEEKEVFRRALSRWSNVTKLVFREGEAYESADIKIAFARGEHGDGEAFDGRLGTLAHAFSPPSGRLHLDEEEEWVVVRGEGGMMGSGQVDMESVAVHEIGHVLGLGHSGVEASVMYPTITSAQRKVLLHADDVEGIQALYGVNPDYHSSSSSSSSSSSATTSATSSSSGDEKSGAAQVSSCFFGVFFLPLSFVFIFGFQF